MWQGLSAIFQIFNKLTPERKEAYQNELNKLEVEYDKALKDNRDTDAAVIRKKMSKLRKKLGYSDL
jgi:hypothetical protein